MADPEFETRLGRWFTEAPAFADADRFADRVQERLDRSWAVRRMLIGVAGLAGGLIAAGQMLGARLFDRIAGASEASVATAASVGQGVKTLSQLRFLTELPVGTEVMWMGAGLAILAVGLMAARTLEEF